MGRTMNPARRRIYSWAIFLALLLVFLAIVWVVLHTEPAAAPDYQGRLTSPGSLSGWIGSKISRAADVPGSGICSKVCGSICMES